ncbi:hypothetical protein [Herbaspirillum camelliae]|uniref:hypothetical protein n=1 Tax=Herbaspirillum camelliae TaxID=1892903 RepID=UPI000949CEF8|nr:hypothetical protein [Herbaspirillum camelliae]
MESKPVYQLDHPRRLKALVVLIAFSTLSSIMGLIRKPYEPWIGINFLVLMVTGVVPWIHYLEPSRIGEVVMKILCVVQALASAVYFFFVFEPEFYVSSGPGKWLLLFLAQILSLVYHWLLFKAVSVHAENSDVHETVQ